MGVVLTSSSEGVALRPDKAVDVVLASTVAPLLARAKAAAATEFPARTGSVTIGAAGGGGGGTGPAFR